MTADLAFATNLARQAGQALVGLFQESGTRARMKRDLSVVTEADLEADRIIAAALQAHDPHVPILSEELSHDLPQGAGGAWIVDPLDGTTNYSLGLHYWGVSIARLEAGWPVLGAIYFPVLGEMYTASLQGGAYLNGARIEVGAPDPDQPTAFFSCCSRTHQRFQVRVPYKTRILGSAAYSLCAVARGSALLAFEATPKIWDLAASWLIVCEAGGVVEPYNQRPPFPLRPKDDHVRMDYPTLAAATPELATKGRGWIQPR